MSLETMAYIQENFLVGLTNERGHAWHYRQDLQGSEPNHYPGFIPVEDVRRRLLSWKPIEASQAYILEGSHDIALATFEREGKTFSIIPSSVGRKGILRNDTLRDLGSFKEGYTPHDFDEWLIELTEDIVGDSLGITSAILMQDGARMAIEFSLPQSVESSVGLPLLPPILAWSSFDGSLATGWGRFTTAVVCDNTFSMARSEKEKPTYRVRHTKYSSAKIGEAREALAIVYQTAEEFAAEIDSLAEWKVSDSQWNKLLDTLIPENAESKSGKTLATKKRDSLNALYKNDERAATWNGSALGVLQAFSTYAQHETQVRKGTPRVVRNYGNVISGAFAKNDTLVLDTLAEITRHENVISVPV